MGGSVRKMDTKQQSPKVRSREPEVLRAAWAMSEAARGSVRLAGAVSGWSDASQLPPRFRARSARCLTKIARFYMFMFGSNANFARVFGRHDAPGRVTIKSRQGKIQLRMHADGRENAAWTPRHHGASDSSQTVSWTILDQSPTCCPSPGHLFRCCNPLSLSDFFSLAHPASSRCSATNVALWRLLTRPVWWHCPGTQCLGPKCPCAGSLALKALIEAEVSYTLTSFASSRGHESPGYPDRQRPLCLAGLSCCCSLPQAQ